MCPKRWEAKYILGVEDPPNEFTFFGLVDHRAKEEYFRLKKEGRDLDIEEALDVYEAVWNGDYNDEDFEVARDQVEFFAGERSTFLQGLDLFKSFLKRISWRPAVIEETYERPLDYEYIKSFVSRVDMITEDGTVVDFKTTYKNIGTEYSPPAVKYHMQPTSYAYVLDRPIEFKFVIGQRRERKIYVRGTTRTQQDVDWMHNELIPKTVASIESGRFPPTPGRHCDNCPIKKTCGYRL